jgi:hypothetical protein
VAGTLGAGAGFGAVVAPRCVVAAVVSAEVVVLLVYA